MTSRDRILARLRANRPPFPDAAPRPEAFRSVTQVDPADLLPRFTAEVERLTGKVHACQTEAEAKGVISDIIGTDRRVMAWGTLPLPDLGAALSAAGVQIVVPQARGTGADRREALLDIEPIRVGITGADAGLATTGSLVMITTGDQGRLPSLMPPVHIAVLRRERLFASLEAWMAAEGREALTDSNSITLITGPSRTGDIEMMIVLGVHGPGQVHIVLV
jgi:L-lactate dehydrogenase complex protein LldG